MKRIQVPLEPRRIILTNGRNEPIVSDLYPGRVQVSLFADEIGVFEDQFLAELVERGGKYAELVRLQYGQEHRELLESAAI